MAGPDEQPQWRFLFMPASDVEIVDTWHVAGLRGTASHDVLVNGVLIPRERTANPIFEQAPHDEPHFRWSFFGLLGALMSGFPLGVARRSLDEFSTLAGTKGRGGGEALATEQVVQIEVARCEGALRAARTSMFDSLASAWDTAVNGDDVSREQRLTIRLAAQNAMRVAIDVADTMFATQRVAGRFTTTTRSSAAGATSTRAAPTSSSRRPTWLGPGRCCSASRRRSGAVMSCFFVTALRSASIGSCSLRSTIGASRTRRRIAPPH